MKNIIMILCVLSAILITGCSNDNVTGNVAYNVGYVGAKGEVLTKSISINALSSHDDLSDCWIAYGRDVYDISDYLISESNNHVDVEELSQYCGTSSFEVVVDSYNIKFSEIESKSVYEGTLDG